MDAPLSSGVSLSLLTVDCTPGNVHSTCISCRSQVPDNALVYSLISNHRILRTWRLQPWASWLATLLSMTSARPPLATLEQHTNARVRHVSLEGNTSRLRLARRRYWHRTNAREWSKIGMLGLMRVRFQ